MNNIRIFIRQERSGEAKVVYEVNKLAFDREDEAKLVDNLRKTEEFIPELSLVAEDGEENILGYILFTKIRIVGEREHKSLALAPMAVLPDNQNSGIGLQLIEAGLERAYKLGYGSVIVLGHKDYYPRFGFRPASHWGIKCPIEVPDEVFMAKELIDGCLSGKSGIVKYSKAFGL